MNRISWFLLLLCSVVLAITGCHHGFSSPYGVRGLRLSEPVFPVYGMWLPDSTLRLSFNAPRTLRTNDPLIRTMYLAVGSRRGTYTDTIDVQIPERTMSEATADETFDADVYVSGLRGSVSEPPYVDVSMVTGSDHVTFESPVAMTDAVPVELRPYARSTAQGTVDIGAEVRRIYLTTEEYLPSTEDVRIMIADINGANVWRSDDGLMFSTMIMKVQPQDRGAVANVERRWNGRDSGGQAVPPGTYRATIIIPAIPQSYQASIDITWPPQR